MTKPKTLEQLRTEKERAETQLALYNEDIVVTGHELDIEWSIDMQRCSYLPAHPLDTPYGLNIYLLWRELDCSITGMNTCKFDVFGYCIRHNLTVTCYSIHFYFLGMFYELADHNRMLCTYICRKFEETLKFVTV